MIETIAGVLVVLWLLGFVTSCTMGGPIHVVIVTPWRPSVVGTQEFP